ncbi:MAG: radical SAM family heme chaperone HemW [Gammaproteobacteria bacterium]|jgi:oxygen-independent coproporphyrinogen-3 oxidase
MFTFTTTPPLSLYIHIPWCVRKCPYCDFNSHAARDEIPEQAYMTALLADLEQELPAVWGRTVETIFIGGGTPSLISAAALDRLLAEIRARLPVKPGAEITLEANPGTVDQTKFAGFREAGITRLSLGIQSFQPALLKNIGRIHDDSAALAAFRAARQAGFENINLDLMFGLPGQDIAQAVRDLHTATALAPEHLSWYELTIEPNTWFHHHPPARVDDEARWEIQAAGHTLLQQTGYTRYEISAYAQSGRQCRHNLNYWQFGDYLGIGAGAHGKITDAALQCIYRVAKVRHPRSYLETAHTPQRISSRIELEPDDVLLEFAMNALRLDSGFSTAGFTAATGLPAGAIEPGIQQAIRQGLLVRDRDNILTTAHGQRYLNDLLQYWIPEQAAHAG